MGNCGSNPKTNESPELPEPHVTEEDTVELKENVETNTEETPKDSDNKSLATLLNEKAEEAAKVEEVKAEAKAEEEKPKAEEAKTEA